MPVESHYSTGDLEALARTLLGTCAREPWPVKVAVAQVILNRARRGGWWGESIAEVCHAPWQFDCWSDPAERRRISAASCETPALRECLAAAAAVLAGLEADRTGGACHLMPRSTAPRGPARHRSSAVIGPFAFYRDCEEEAS